MHHLIFDTCVWGDLAVKEFHLVAKLQSLIQARKVTIVLPEIVIREWEGCKARLSQQIGAEVVECVRSIKRLDSYVNGKNNADTKKLLEIDPNSLAASRFQSIDEILYSEAVVLLSASSQNKNLAIEHALAKLAPFGEKNSMADALIFFSSVDWANKNNELNVTFITHNVRDFCAKVDTPRERRLPDELKKLIKSPRLKVEFVIGRILHEIDELIVTDEEVRVSDEVVDRITARVGISESLAALLERDHSANFGISESLAALLAKDYSVHSSISELSAAFLARDLSISSGLRESLESMRANDHFETLGMKLSLLTERDNLASKTIAKIVDDNVASNFLKNPDDGSSLDYLQKFIAEQDKLSNIVNPPAIKGLKKYLKPPKDI